MKLKISLSFIIIFFFYPTNLWPDNEPIGLHPNFTITAYVPSYNLHTVEGTSLALVDRIIYFGVGIKPDGSIAPVPTHHLNLLRQWKSKYAVEVYLGIVDHGGLRATEIRGFKGILRVPSMKDRFLESLNDEIDTTLFSGIDIDWEWPDRGWESTEFSTLLLETAIDLKNINLGVSVAMSPWQSIDSNTAGHLSGINLMLYDNSGFHSTFEIMVRDIERFLSINRLKPHTVSAGLPYYGRGIGSYGRTWNSAVSYRTIKNSYKIDSYQDVVGGFYFNNKKTLIQKTQYAIEKELGGLMIWHLGMDIHGSDSLTQTIKNKINTMKPKSLWLSNIEDLLGHREFISQRVSIPSSSDKPNSNIPVPINPDYLSNFTQQLALKREE